MIEMIDLISAAIPFEIQKAGFDFHLEEWDKQQRIEIISRIQEKIYGSQIKNNKDEVSSAKKSLGNALNKDDLGSEIYNNLGLIESHEVSYAQETTQDSEKIDLDAIKMNPEDFKKVLDLCLQIEGIDKQVIFGNVSNFTDGIGNPIVPYPDSGYWDNITVARTLELIQHEISTHEITDINHSQFSDLLRGANYMPREESLAMALEKQLGN